MVKNFFINLQCQKLLAAQAAAFGQRFLCLSSLELIYRIVWGIGNDPKGFAEWTLTARNAVFLLSKFNCKNYERKS